MKKWCGILALTFAFCFSLVAHAGPGIGGAPLNPVDPDNPGWFIYDLDRGESYDDVLLVKNTTDEVWDVLIYPADYLASSGGGFAVKQRGEDMTEMGAWIELSETRFSMEPNSSREVPFTIRIPEDSEAGEIGGAIMMEKYDPETAEQENIETAGGFRLNFRSGVRVYNTLPEGISENMSFGSATLTLDRNISNPQLLKNPEFTQKMIDFYEKWGNFELGGVQFVFTDKYLEESEAQIESFVNMNSFVKNGGNISGKLYFKYSMRDLLFENVYYDNSSEDRHFLAPPGSDFESNHRIDTLPLFGIVKVETKILHSKKDGTVKELFSQEKTLVLFPLKDFLINFLIIVAVIILIVGYRRFLWKKYIVKSRETLESLALRYDVRKSKLAKKNKMKIAGSLKSGQKIFIPRFGGDRSKDAPAKKTAPKKKTSPKKTTKKVATKKAPATKKSAPKKKTSTKKK